MRPIWYTDGACSNNGSSNATGGFGVVCIDEDTGAILYQYQEFHNENVTNNRMEMMAIIHAIKKAYEDKPKFIPTIISDSAYAVNSFYNWIYAWERNGWTKANGEKLENLDLIKEYYDLVENQGYCISLQKIKGHAGNYGNELCDKLATGKIILDNQKNLDKFEKM